MTGRPRHLALIHLLGAICVLVTSFNAAALAAGSSTGAEAVAEPRPIRSFEGITEYELDNGLQVLICPDPYTPTITVNMTYRVGSRHEGAGEAGMAHMLEHLLIGRTEGFPSLREALDRTGAEYNGSTWYDRTNFFETLMASEENLDLALHVEAERMVNADFGAEELTREKGVIANEFEMDENDPAKVLSQRHPGLPAGKRAELLRTALSARQRHADHRRTFRPRSGAPARREVLREDSRSRPEFRGNAHGRAGAGRAAQRHSPSSR
jgi:hypothetical protein